MLRFLRLLQSLHEKSRRLITLGDVKHFLLLAMLDEESLRLNAIQQTSATDCESIPLLMYLQPLESVIRASVLSEPRLNSRLNITKDNCCVNPSKAAGFAYEGIFEIPTSHNLSFLRIPLILHKHNNRWKLRSKPKWSHTIPSLGFFKHFSLPHCSSSVVRIYMYEVICQERGFINTLETGIATALSVWVVPLLLLPTTPSRTIVNQFNETIRRGGTYLQTAARLVAFALAVTIFLTFGVADWNSHLAALVIMLSTAWWEAKFIFPINDEVKALEGKFEGDDQIWLSALEHTALLDMIKRWRMWHLGRILALLGAACLTLFATRQM